VPREPFARPAGEPDAELEVIDGIEESVVSPVGIDLEGEAEGRSHEAEAYRA
jgi:hypothetical protein